VINLASKQHNLIILCLLFCGLGAFQNSYAQPAYRSGAVVEPGYEGWRPNDDGSFSFIFGYMNENWEEQPDIPVGDNNYFSPGDADRGQPTYFQPRRNRFTFEVVVPSDWGDRELVWTLNHNGIERRAYATLATDYLVDNMVIASETGSLGAGTSSPESRSNNPPVLTIQGDTSTSNQVRNLPLGDGLELVSLLEDDGLPAPRRATLTRTASTFKEQMMRPPSRVTVGKTNGLFLSWHKYRGPGNVDFDPPQVKSWEDTRTSANSPWGPLWVPPSLPDDGLHKVMVSFDAPGIYILRARADDGGLFHDQYVTVNVEP